MGRFAGISDAGNFLGVGVLQEFFDECNFFVLAVPASLTPAQLVAPYRRMISMQNFYSISQHKPASLRSRPKWY